MRSKDMIPRIVLPGYVHKVWGVKTRASSPTSRVTLSKLLNPFEPQILFLLKENGYYEWLSGYYELIHDLGKTWIPKGMDKNNRGPL